MLTRFQLMLKIVFFCIFHKRVHRNTKSAYVLILASVIQSFCEFTWFEVILKKLQILLDSRLEIFLTQTTIGLT